MAFPPEFLDEIRARVSLADLIGRRVRLTKRGREHVGLCPFHNEKSPSFTVSEDKGFFHCFGCGAHGDVIGFVMQNEGLSFPEAVERLAGQAGLAMPQTSPEERAAERKRADLHQVLEAATDWFAARLAGTEGAEARAYLERRGLRPATVEVFRLGYAPDRRGALRKALNAKGIDDALLAEAGLIKRPDAEESDDDAPPPAPDREPRDYFFNRVVFPIEDARGRVVAFGGRALGSSPAKYLNSPETALFHKGRLLFNLARARQAAREAGELLVVEGYMDVIALTEAGFPAAVAPLGTALTEDQMGLLWRLADEPLLCLDGDEAGRRAAYRAAERALPLLQPGRSLRFAALPPGEDPDSLLRRDGPPALRRLLERAKPLVEVVWQRHSESQALDTPERRAALRRDLRQTVGQIRDPDVRKAYGLDIAARLDKAFGAPARPTAGAKRLGARFGFTSRTPRDVSLRPLMRQPLEPAAVARREQQVLMAALVNHPGLLGEQAEALPALSYANADLERLARALVDLAVAGQDLDTAAVRRHLCDQGFSGLLEALLHPSVYIHGGFARPETPYEKVRESWVDLLAVHRQRSSRAENEEAAHRLALDMTEDNLRRLQATQRLSDEGESDLDRPESADEGGSARLGDSGR